MPTTLTFTMPVELAIAMPSELNTAEDEASGARPWVAVTTLPQQRKARADRRGVVTPIGPSDTVPAATAHAVDVP